MGLVIVLFAVMLVLSDQPALQRGLNQLHSVADAIQRGKAAEPEAAFVVQQHLIQHVNQVCATPMEPSFCVVV